jgi:putative thioredoxin
MTASDFIIEVSEADFEYQVLAYSQQVPVVVDFWAEWCGPCKVLGPLLERLAEEAQGGFRLAKVNVDENQNLAVRYYVRGIPAVKAFRDGKLVSEFTGVQPEPRVREFLRSIAPNKSDLKLEKALSLLGKREPETAEIIFREVLDESPENSAALLGLAKSLLFQGQGQEAQDILQNFPASSEYAAAENLRPLSDAVARLEQRTLSGDVDLDDPLEAAYLNSLRLVTRGNIPAALDGMLEILRQDKRYRDGEVRLAFLGLLELLGENNPDTRQYRNELASVLF